MGLSQIRLMSMVSCVRLVRGLSRSISLVVIFVSKSHEAPSSILDGLQPLTMVWFLVAGLLF